MLYSHYLLSLVYLNEIWITTTYTWYSNIYWIHCI